MLSLTILGGCGSTGSLQVDDNTYYQLEADVQNVLASPVADAAPLEMKFIREKLVAAKEAKANRKRKLEAQLTEQIYADIKIARMRAELNQLNNELLDKRDQVSAAQLYLAELKERLQ
jgi:outer membrane murein-binding lipoprotein Lpp